MDSPSSYEQGRMSTGNSIVSNCSKQPSILASGPGSVPGLVPDHRGYDEQKLGFVGNCSVAKGVYNVLCALVGAGILGLAYAFRLCGWYGIILLLGLGVLTTYTAWLISKIIMKYPHIRTYSDIGQQAFPRWGHIPVYVCQMIACVGVSIIYLILIGQNMASMMAAIRGIPEIFTKETFWSCAAAVLVLPLSYMKNLEDFAFMALVGMVLSLAAAVCIIVGVFLVPASQTYHHYGDVTFMGVLRGFATMTFAYSAHSVLPDIQRVMKHPNRFPRVIYISFSSCVILYMVTASLGYYTFGEHTHDNILGNLGNIVPSLIAKIAVTAHILFGYVVFLNPVFFSIERPLIMRKLEMERDSQGRELEGMDPPSLNHPLHYRGQRSRNSSLARSPSHLVTVEGAVNAESMNEKRLNPIVHAVRFQGDEEDSEESLEQETTFKDISTEGEVKNLTKTDQFSNQPSINDEFGWPLTPQASLPDVHRLDTSEASLPAHFTTPVGGGPVPRSRHYRRLQKMCSKLSWRLLRIVLRTIVVGLTLLVAVFLPYFGDLMSLIGGSAQAGAIIILPAVFYLATFKSTLKWWEWVLNISIIVLGAFAGTVACVDSIISLVKRAKGG